MKPVPTVEVVVSRTSQHAPTWHDTKQRQWLLSKHFQKGLLPRSPSRSHTSTKSWQHQRAVEHAGGGQGVPAPARGQAWPATKPALVGRLPRPPADTAGMQHIQAGVVACTIFTSPQKIGCSRRPPEQRQLVRHAHYLPVEERHAALRVQL